MILKHHANISHFWKHEHVLGWSVYEVLIRLSGRRYVKDGPWWQANYRYASLMDMLSYVGFKNLLVGTALFILLKSLGLMQV